MDYYYKGWKVFGIDYYGRLVSVFRDHSGSMVYDENKWNFPAKGYGPLAIFGIRVGALWFKLDMQCFAQKFVIRECFYIPSRYDCLWRFENKEKVRKDFLPKNTLLADAVYLCKEEGGKAIPQIPPKFGDTWKSLEDRFLIPYLHNHIMGRFPFKEGEEV